jgi:hypothetical protein
MGGASHANGRVCPRGGRRLHFFYGEREYVGGPAVSRVCRHGDPVRADHPAERLIVETTPRGVQVAHKVPGPLEQPARIRGAVRLAVAPRASGVYYVDDATNFLRLLH